ncbi:hypothetical protein JL722_1869 [Aureococcus anophagefferens]|nr:hypothetical protein JL722_1869 [Aureococcus anophagefferens]
MPGVLLAMLRRAFSSGAAPLRLAGKGAIVTGGGSGIGRGIALAFAAEGASVVVTGRRAQNLQETAALAAELPGTIRAVEADATDRDQSPLVARTLETQTNDILVNNAGFNVRGRAMDRITVGDWHALVDTNLNGAFHLVHAMINLEEHERGIRCTNIYPGEVVTEILDKRDAPPSEAQRARMLQPEDVAAAALFIACLPPRAHVTELTITGKTTLPESL